MKYRVVIAEDEIITRMDIKDRLELAGYDVVGEAGDGFDAIDLCKTHKPDVVLMDIKMPSLDGLSALKIIREEGTCDCAIILSAYSDSDFVDNAADLGVMGYLVKPITDNTLLTTMEVAIRRSREMKKLREEKEASEKQLSDRKVIDKAKGLLMESRKISENEAYEYMRSLSMEKRKSMRNVADMIILSHRNISR